MSKLGDILQEEVTEEIRMILAEAESRAAKLVRAAEETASARLQSHQKKMEAEAWAATWRARSAADLAFSTARTQAKGQMIESVHKRVLVSLEKVSKAPLYGHLLQALAEEALNAVQGGEVLVVHPEDEEKISNWAKQRGLELLTDPELRIGVRIVIRHGKRSVENSLGERLERAWNVLASDVARQLWG
jgi:V/A-type H+-transporting ATPase subunit E